MQAVKISFIKKVMLNLQKFSDILLVPCSLLTLVGFFFLQKNSTAQLSESTISEATEIPVTRLPLTEKTTQTTIKTFATKYDSVFHYHPEFISQSFDFPVGKPDGENYFKAREFGQSKHLGEDWNGIGGGNTDLGDPVYSISNGYVSFSEHVSGGWGNIVRVVHKFPSHPELPYVESIYAHLHDLNVKEGDLVTRGQKIGTIGTADGKYSAHLHLELRSFIDMGIGPGYSEDTFGFMVPTDFIEKF